MTALRFQTGCDIKHSWPPFRGRERKMVMTMMIVVMMTVMLLLMVVMMTVMLMMVVMMMVVLLCNSNQPLTPSLSEANMPFLT